MEPSLNWESGRTAAIVLAILAGPACAWAQATGGPSRIFTCTDARGQRHTSDRPIFDCLDREQRELSPSGLVVRTVKPRSTQEEEAAARKAEAEAAARADALILERAAAARRRLAAQQSAPVQR
jgi:hypothetical protein